MVSKRNLYPIVLAPAAEGGYSVAIPDFGAHTQGDCLVDALNMAQDAIQMMSIYFRDDNKPIPEPSDINLIKTKTNEVKTCVHIDFEEYRREADNRMIQKNITIPSWLNVRAEDEGVDLSELLQDALMAKLGVEA